MNQLLLTLAETASEPETKTSDSSTEKITSALKSMVQSPVFYVVIGALVLLIIAVYLLRRIVKPRAGVVTVVVRRSGIHKLVDEKSSNYFMIPFIDRIGAVISLKEQELSSDKLFINNGPDALYQINFTLTYKVLDPQVFYPYNDNIQKLVVEKMNEDLREFADSGNALMLIKDYRENAAQILELINEAIKPYCVEATAFKINLIQPLGR